MLRDAVGTLGLPDVEDVRMGVLAARLRPADLVKRRPGAWSGTKK